MQKDLANFVYSSVNGKKGLNGGSPEIRFSNFSLKIPKYFWGPGWIRTDLASAHFKLRRRLDDPHDSKTRSSGGPCCWALTATWTLPLRRWNIK